ncbi:MAG: 1,4-dihydroxy-2-naphthoyl-CoA hydrolase [Cyanobacteria bacterium QS_8_64_29]|nr:MAG: 1,4-dihydroxy-2-naphthoyl-CoA hydrolase [Cyanobacteria bacterium QS_8_64_29]
MGFRYERTVRLADTDAAGVVYFARVLSMCHEAYEASLEAAGVPLASWIREGTIALPIVHAHADFYRPLSCGDQLAIALAPQPLGDSEFAVAYELTGQEPTGPKLAEATTRHACIQPQQRQRIPLPVALWQWLQAA